MTGQAFDLDKLIQTLQGDRRYSNDVRILEEFASASSILRDLLAAQESLLTLAKIQDDDMACRSFGQKLLMHAIITYSRALISRTNFRRTIDVPKKAFTKDQCDLHAAISDLRSTALAHYHAPLGKFAAEWMVDKTVIISRESEFDPLKDVYIRSNYTKVTTHALWELLNVAIEYVQQERSRQTNAVRELLSEQSSDQYFHEKLQACPFFLLRSFSDTITIP